MRHFYGVSLRRLLFGVSLSFVAVSSCLVAGCSQTSVHCSYVGTVSLDTVNRTATSDITASYQNDGAKPIEELVFHFKSDGEPAPQFRLSDLVLNATPWTPPGDPSQGGQGAYLAVRLPKPLAPGNTFRYAQPLTPPFKAPMELTIWRASGIRNSSTGLMTFGFLNGMSSPVTA